ncbi:FecR domain-containing protein [Pseudofulvibacter geojedonensis]|uniref:FecR domain-containing protein n=1 Tax=Pseudofulvibacter geojedonensis TaxID=1123758 RepID=A0ABW3I4M9_9FLAO
MKQLLFWFFALLFFNNCYTQEQTVFEEEDLSVVLPAIESFYNARFSYQDKIIQDKKASILLDKIIPLESLLQTLSAQTSLKFELLKDNYIVISDFKKQDNISICGQLLSNNEKIGNATLKIGKSYYSSDENGNFKIDNIPFNETIIITSFGVKKTKIKASSHIYPNCNTINLTEKKELLDQVVIADYLTSGISKNVKQTTIHRDKLKILPGLIEPDVLESIHLMPGVTNLNETANSIHVRGGNADQNLVLWNNIKTYNNAHLFGMISAFNPYIIDKVNFINKGTDVKYGERISSVIEMKSNYIPAKKLSGGAGFNMLHADAYVDVPVVKNKLSFQVSGRRSYSNLLETFTYKKLAERVFQNTKIVDNTLDFSESKNIFWFQDYTFNMAWKPSKKDLIKINALHNKNHLNFSAFNKNKTNLYIDELDTQNNGYNIEWEKEWLPNLSHQIDAYVSNYNLDYSFSDTSSNGVIKKTKNNTIKDFGINYNIKYEINREKELNLGYQFTNKKVNYLFTDTDLGFTSFIDGAKNQTKANSFYLGYQISKPKNHLFSVGLRANKYSISDELLVEPRAIFQKFVTNEFSINASLEYKSQFINQIQESVISNLSLENHIWALSNSDRLSILNSYQYTIGANYSKNKWVLDLEAYFKKTKGLNTLNLDLNNPILIDYKEGSSSIQGIDFFVKKQLKKYNTWLSYSFNSAKYTFPDLNNGKPFPSNVNIDHTIKWSHFYKWKNFEVSLGWLWHNGKPFTHIRSSTDNNGNTSYSFNNLNDENLPIYHRLDLSAVYDFKPHQNKKIKYRLGLSVLNLYNRKNIINKDISYNTSNNNEINITDITATSITPNLMFRIFW